MTCTAKEAYTHAEILMEGMKKKAIDYIYDWNELLLFLGEKVKEEENK